ncbi:MAG TPA: hypothetical protein VK825_05320 [Xanthobacteraceae bacterium]|nr:hypothetical protein [Xanthobacteraceae bacterium]
MRHAPSFGLDFDLGFDSMSALRSRVGFSAQGNLVAMMNLVDCGAYDIMREAHCDGSIADLAAALPQDHSGGLARRNAGFVDRQPRQIEKNKIAWFAVHKSSSRVC